MIPADEIAKKYDREQIIEIDEDGKVHRPLSIGDLIRQARAEMKEECWNKVHAMYLTNDRMIWNSAICAVEQVIRAIEVK